MTTALLWILAGLVLLVLGAEGLVRGSAALALRAGLAPLVIGLTVVAFGTSSPELVVSLNAAFDGRGDISLGNVIGSNIGNVALILGVCVLIRPVHVERQLIRRDVPLMLAATLLLWALLADGALGRIEGLVLVTGLVGYTLFNLRQGIKAPPAEEEAVPTLPGPWWVDVALLVGGLGLLVLGADWLVGGAVVVAERFGLSDAVIGLTVVAFGTSLPELATTVVAATKGESDLAVGNVVGSNVFNVLGILGVSAAVHPLSGGGVTTIDLAVATGFAALLLPLMWTGFRLVRWEGVVLLLLYAAYIAYLLV